MKLLPQSLYKSLITTWLIIWIAICTNIVVSAWYIFDFDTNLETYFPWYTNNLSYLSFQYGPNSFVWAFLPLWQVTVDDTTIDVDGTLITWCNQQIKWLYYNSARGNRVWPLDTATHTTLKTMNSSYIDLNFTWWLYLNCYWQDPDQIYGQITHEINGIEYKIIWWVEMDFVNNSYHTGFDLSTKNDWWYITGFIFDNVWGIAKVQFDDIVIWSIIMHTNSDVIEQNGDYYTDTTGLQLTLVANKNVNYVLDGDLNIIYNWTFSGNVEIATYITPTNGDKSIVATFLSALWWGEPYVYTSHINLDVMWPTKSILNDMADINTAVTSWFTMSWSVATDTWIGLDKYNYLIYSGNNILFSWDTTSTSVHIDTSTRWTGIYTWYIKAIDKFWFSSLSSGKTIELVYLPDVEPAAFELNTIHDADLNKTYKSDIIVIHGLDPNISILAEISRWALFIDGVFSARSWYVSNDSVVWIELTSSDKYEWVSSSTLYIGTLRDRFALYTKDQYINKWSDSSATRQEALRNSAKAKIFRVFNSLKRTYSRNPIVEKQFFYLLRTKVSDGIRLLEDELNDAHSSDTRYKISLSLWLYEYLHGLVINHIWDMEKDTTTVMDAVDKYGIYKAPNGKKYEIIIDYSRGWAITSPDFITKKFFPTWKDCKHHIDINNQ